MNARQANEISIVEYLSKIGYEPAYKRGQRYWYHSPLHDEKTPSFAVNIKLNRWYDWGGDEQNKKGNLVDFGIRFHKCSVEDFLQKLTGPAIAIPKHQKLIISTNEVNEKQDEIKVVSVCTLNSFPLLRYLEERRIAKDIALQFCREVHYQLHGKNYYAIGFPNDNGGFALRNKHVKSAASPNGITFINNDAKDVANFEGFFDFLSYKSLYRNQDEPRRNYLILNSASFFETALPIMQSHERNFLFFDTDKKGNELTQRALDFGKVKFVDERSMYRNYKDLNDWYMNFGRTEKHRFMHKL